MRSIPQTRDEEMMEILHVWFGVALRCLFDSAAERTQAPDKAGA